MAARFFIMFELSSMASGCQTSWNGLNLPPAGRPSTETLSTAVQHGLISGAVALVADREQDALWRQSIGLRDEHTAMTEDTLFWVASGLSKPLAAAAAMTLVDAGLLDLDVPIHKSFAAWPRHPPHSRITVRMLLSHTSGLPFASTAELRAGGGLERFRGSQFMRYRETDDDACYDVLSLQEAASSYADEILVSEPGTAFLCARSCVRTLRRFTAHNSTARSRSHSSLLCTDSNAGFNLVGRLIEVLSGTSYATFIEETLLQPLRMRDTTLYPSTQQLTRLAKSYASDASVDGKLGPQAEASRCDLIEVPFPQLTMPYSDRSRGCSPAGGFFSTAVDCARFGRMILRGGELDGQRVLSQRAVDEMTALQTAGCGDGTVAYGLGWRLRAESGGGFGHRGAMGTDLWIDPDPAIDRCTVLMCHRDGGED